MITYIAHFGSWIGTLDIEFQAPDLKRNSPEVVSAAMEKLALIVRNVDMWQLNDIRGLHD